VLGGADFNKVALVFVLSTRCNVIKEGLVVSYLVCVSDEL
jgi:hypothetical protein